MNGQRARGWWKTLAGFAAFTAVLLIGDALGIDPSLAELLLIVAAVGALETAETLVARPNRLRLTIRRASDQVVLTTTDRVAQDTAREIVRAIKQYEREHGGKR